MTTAAPSRQPGLPLGHIALAVAIMAVWGTNFTVIRVGLNHLPPLLFAALRFTFALFPACLFIRPPKGVPWKDLAAYGVAIGAGQFGLLFMAINGHISPGLASLVVQVQIFFTVGLSMLLTGERIQRYQLFAVALAVSGIVLIAMKAGGQATPLGLMMIFGAALGWSIGNIVTRRHIQANMLAFVIWGSLFSLPPLFALSFALEGWDAIRAGVINANAAAWAAVLWQSFGNVLFGYAAWAWLLARHPAATVTPMALLVPVFGLGASAVFLGEPMQAWKIAATALVMAGLAFNLLWPRFKAKFP